ncbi:replication initiation and membrane attachment family protein [Numidum massiliense]|uniref:replication initiation and membrane attachment family protein n=1 Tax=Numidum massiliense TaxID=1522315 RepID=UPI0006D54D6B|nr:DnaD domain protein [Numidum massiliense]
MSWAWQELSPGDSWTVKTHRPLQAAEISALMHLYQPIIGVEAAALYITLALQGSFYVAAESPAHTHRFLLGLLALPLDRILAARHKLEAVGLLKTFKRGEELGNHYRYVVMPPLEPSTFFKTDVLSITLLNRLGKERFRFLREQFTAGEQAEGETEAQEVTKKFGEVFTSITPSELTVGEDSELQPLVAQLETAAATDVETGPNFTGDTLDWSFLEAHAAAVGSLEALTAEERDIIAGWAFFYQLEEIELAKALQNPRLYDEANTLKLDRLHAFIKQEYRFRYGVAPDLRVKQPMVPAVEPLPGPTADRSTDQTKNQSAASHPANQPAASHPANQAAASPDSQADGGRGTGEGAQGGERQPREQQSVEDMHRQWLSKLSPLELLERYQRGGKIPEADIELVEALYEQYGLPTGVINVLIEYVLLTNEYKLPRPLVEKMAGHWRRANVKTVEEAQALALRQQQQPRTRAGRDPYTKARKGPYATKAKSRGTSSASRSTGSRREQARNPARNETEEVTAEDEAQFAAILQKLRKNRGG